MSNVTVAKEMPAVSNTNQNIDIWRTELATRFRCGVNFTGAGAVLWLLIAIVWAIDINSTVTLVATVAIGSCITPIAIVLGKLLHIPQTAPNNPLGFLSFLFSAGQFLCLPLLMFLLFTEPQLYLIASATVTGAHFLNYAWLYRSKAYLVVAIISVLGVVGLGILLEPEMLFVIPVFMLICTLVLSVWADRESQAMRSLDGQLEQS